MVEPYEEAAGQRLGLLWLSRCPPDVERTPTVGCSEGTHLVYDRAHAARFEPIVLNFTESIAVRKRDDRPCRSAQRTAPLPQCVYMICN